MYVTFTKAKKHIWVLHVSYKGIFQPHRYFILKSVSIYISKAHYGGIGHGISQILMKFGPVTYFGEKQKYLGSTG